MIDKYTSQNANNLNSHEAFDTMYMSKEQLEAEKKLAKENGFGNDLKKYFVGVGLGVVGISLAGLSPLIIANPIISTGIMAAGGLTAGILGMKRFFKLRKSSQEIKEGIANIEEDESHKMR